MSEDSRKYGAESTCTSGSTLSRAALSYARARAQMEKERGNLLKAFGTQVWICVDRYVVYVWSIMPAFIEQLLVIAIILGSNLNSQK